MSYITAFQSKLYTSYQMSCKLCNCYAYAYADFVARFTCVSIIPCHVFGVKYLFLAFKKSLSSAGRIHDPIEQKPPVSSQSSKVRGAISALVGTPQAVYMYTQNQVRLLKYKGVYQTFEGQFIATAPIGRDGAPKRLGQYSNMLVAAQAHDEAMFQRYGFVAKHKLNFPAEHIRSVES